MGAIPYIAVIGTFFLVFGGAELSQGGLGWGMASLAVAVVLFQVCLVLWGADLIGEAVAKHLRSSPGQDMPSPEAARTLRAVLAQRKA